MNEHPQNSSFKIVEGAFDANDDKYQLLSPLSSLNTTLDGLSVKNSKRVKSPRAHIEG